MKRIVALLLVLLFIALTFSSCGAKSLKGKTYEVTKVKVSFSREAKKEFKELGIDVKDAIELTKSTFEGVTFSFDEKSEDFVWKINGSKVKYGVYDFVYTLGKLVLVKGDGSTVKLTIKEIK